MATRDLIVIGASAGGVEALTAIVRDLPPDLPATVCVVLHLPPNNPSVLPNILRRSGPLKAINPRDGEPMRRGVIYVAPPDRHLLVKPGLLRLTRGPRENGFRPAVDPLFRTAALTCGPRTIAVILSGNLDDGTIGAAAVRRRQGLVVVQDPAEAAYPGMPASVIEQVGADHIVGVAQLGALLARLVREEVPERAAHTASDRQVEIEVDMAEMDEEAMNAMHHPGKPSGFGCPDCGGVLFELQEGDVPHFRCRVGHAWSPDSLLTRQTDTLEGALWTALRALEENVALATTIADRLRARGGHLSARRFDAQAKHALRQANVIREALLQPRMDPDARAELDGAEVVANQVAK